MGCRIGISKTPTVRIQYWQEKEGHTGGQILASGLTFDEALDRAQLEAEKLPCRQSAGGVRDRTSRWSVYLVWGG